MTNEKNVEFQKMVFDLSPFPSKNYDNFDLDRLAIYALYVLEDNKVPLYFDYIAVGLFKIFPRKFSMANFKNYPDTNRISKALRRLTDQKRKRWAIGNIENGFHITDLGRETARQVSGFLENPESKKHTKPVKVTKSRGRSLDDDTREVRQSEAFKKWQNGEEINNYEFFAFLKAAPYTPKQLLLQHLTNLQNSAKVTKNKETSEFLDWLESKFKNLLY